MPEEDVAHPRLDRQGRTFGRVGGRFIALWLVLFVPGILLVVLTSGWLWYSLGWVLIAFSLLFGAVAVGLFSISGVARWAARHRPFA